jgi:hypothetical protein
MRPIILVFASLLCFAGCGGRTAAAPQIPRQADPAVREQVYAANRLSFEGGFWTNKWTRADGAYNVNSVGPAVDAYPESKAARSRARKRGLLVSILSATGGAIIGVTLGMQLFPPPEEDQQLSGGAAAALYGTGAALAIIGIVVERSWARPAYRDVATTYNAALRRDLALESEGAAPPPGETAPAPGPLSMRGW